MVPRDEAQDERKLDALKNALAQIEKQYGKGSIMRMGAEARPEIEGISTGSLSLDIALGGIGVPRGRVLEIFGPESSGKTTLCLTIVANAQRNGGYAAYIDAEHALDPTYAEKLGVNINELYLVQPDSGEQALDITETLVRSNAMDVIVIDSVAALVPKTELEGEIGDQHVGLQARLMSQALRKLTSSISKSKTCVIFINQLRDKIGGFGYGNPETTPGGRALKFYASVRIDIRRIGTIKEGDVAIGNRVNAKVVKNKIAPPFKHGQFDLMFDSGISLEGDLLDLGESAGILKKSGTWIQHGETRLGQGREKAKEFLRQEKAAMRSLEKEVRAHFDLAPRKAPKDAEPVPVESEKDQKKAGNVKLAAVPAK